MENPTETYLKGRGSQFNPKNKFIKNELVKEHAEGIDDWIEKNEATQYLEDSAKGIVNKITSPDLGMWYSMNPYQGCEHGCIYCYARNAHEYWGYSAGLDFETKIIVKKNAPQLFRKFLMHPKWEPMPISLSGNTDCYQPAEKKFRITRQILEIALEFGQPMGVITKNAGILRDKDILQKMAERNLIGVFVSLTSLNEDLRRILEPRTTTGAQRLRIIRELSDAGIPVGVMTAPLIPGLNEHELPTLLKRASEAGAKSAGYTFVRLNGSVKLIFHDWLFKNFPDRANKVWHMIEQAHGGKVNDTNFGRRMQGEGNIAEMIARQFQIYTIKYGLDHGLPEIDTTSFRRPGEQMSMF